MKQELPVRKPRGFHQFRVSMKHAIDGIIYAFSVEQNMFLHVVVMLVVVGMGIFFELSQIEWLFCLVMFGLVISTELINTAIEAVVDLVTEKYHVLAKVAKDAAAGAVLIFAVTAATGGLVIFVPKIVFYFETLIL